MSVAHIEETLIGVFALTSEGKIIDQIFYPSNPKQIARAIMRQRRGEVTREVRNLLRNLAKRGFDKVSTTNAELADRIEGEFNIQVEVVLESPVEDFSDKLNGIAIKLGIVKDEKGYIEFLREISTILYRGAITEALSSGEAIISQTEIGRASCRERV